MEAGGRAERQAEGSAGSREPPRRGLSLAARGPGAIVWLPAQAPVTASASWGAPRGRGAEGASGPFGEPGAAGGGRDGGFARCRDVVANRNPERRGRDRGRRGVHAGGRSGRRRRRGGRIWRGAVERHGARGRPQAGRSSTSGSVAAERHGARGGAEAVEARRRSELERGAEEAGALGARARAATPSWRERRSWTGLRVDFVEVRGFFCKTSGKRTIWAIRSPDRTAEERP